MAKKQQSRPKKAATARKKPTTARSTATTPTRKAVDKIDAFLREYIKDFNGRRAAIAAGYEPARARVTACELLKRPDVDARLQELLSERAERTGITADLVLHRLQAIATADPRELIEVHRVCCRYCWGKDHLFQRTPREMREARAQYEQALIEARQKAKAAGLPEPIVPPFDEAGGIGFNPHNDPNPNCPECFGEGETRVVAKDTRDLSPSARLLYAGAKQTQHGLEVRMHDQIGATRDLGKHLGLFKEKVELTGKDGGPVEHAITDVLAAIDGAETGVGPASSRKG